jgi:MoaA/NifB/PqqE/SkfB family radical SAM enzyme
MESEHDRKAVAFDGRVPYPRFASIETTMKCNLQCPMCLPYLDGSTVAGMHMDLGDFEKVARAVFPYVDTFQLTVSGEPLMTKGLGRMLELAEEYGVRCEYYTNGTLLNDRMIAMVLPTLGQMCFSFDGGTRETFEILRKGAKFDEVMHNIGKLAAEVAKLPADERPSLGLAVTAMEKNVRELPAMVEIAHQFRLDFVSIAHLLPVIPEMQPQSLAHHPALAKEWIGKALARARELGVAVVVAPLDQVIATMATSDRASGHDDRAIAAQDGVLEGFQTINAEQRRPKLPPPVTNETAREHVAARPARRRREGLTDSAASDAALPASIWYCDFLWDRIYVNADGSVRPCCVPGVPDIGDFRKGGFEGVWDGDAYRAMRIGLVRKEPAPVCRGCLGIREITDPAAIREALQDRGMPAPMALPPALVPVVESPACVHPPVESSATPPVVSWPRTPGTLGYEFEASCEGPKRKLRFDTALRGADLAEPVFRIPDWLWNQAPFGSTVEWRAIARLPEARNVVARGALVRLDPASLPVVGGDLAHAGAPVPTAVAPSVRWAAVPGAGGYVFEASLDGFGHVDFSTIGARLLDEPAFDVPQPLWAQVPPGSECHWRALAVFSGERRVVAGGAFVRDERGAGRSSR